MLELVAATEIPDIISITDVPVENPAPSNDITFEQIEPCPIDDHATYGIMIIIE